MPGRHPRLFPQLADRGLLGGLVPVAPPFGDLPGVAVDRVAVLPDEPHPPLSVDGQDTHRPALEMDDPVNPRLAVGTEDPVLAERDPGVLINLAAFEGGPGVTSVGWVLAHVEVWST